MNLHSVYPEHRPHRLHKDVAGKLWETISYPYFDRNDGPAVIAYVKARVPGDPTTIRTFRVAELDPEGRECYCAAAQEVLGRSEYYYVDERNAPK